MPMKYDQLTNLKSAAELHLSSSNLNLCMLRNMSQPSKSEKNLDPWKTLRQGSYFLENAYRLIELYKEYASGLIDNINMKAVNEMLLRLEFEPEHITYGYTREMYNGKNKCFISKGQSKKYYNLLYSKSKKDVREFIKLVELDIDLPVKEFLKSVNQDLKIAVWNEDLLKAVKNNNFEQVKSCVGNEIDVNIKDADGKTLLHHAVKNDNVEIVRILLIKGADVTYITTEGKTLLHIATSKGNEEIVQVLLQYINLEELKNFIDAKITSDGTTSLHIAAMNSFLNIIKTLLKHGATYDIKNNEDKTPIDVTKNENVNKFLNFVEDLFVNVRNGVLDVISKLRAVESDKFAAVTKARNNQGYTLLQVAADNTNLNVLEKLLEMKQNANSIHSRSILECDLDQLQSIKRTAENYKKFSMAHLSTLQNKSRLYNSQDKIYLRWQSLKDGSYYLVNAYNVINECKKFSINDENIQTANDTLVDLQFDPKHISKGFTDEFFDGKQECFVSKGQDTKYYNLLHSARMEDVRLFIEMVEKKIDEPIKKFLQSIDRRLQLQQK